MERYQERAPPRAGAVGDAPKRADEATAPCEGTAFGAEAPARAGGAQSWVWEKGQSREEETGEEVRGSQSGADG